MPTGTLTGVAHSVGSMTPSRSLHLSLAGVETSTGSLTPSMTRHATLAGLANNHGYSVGYKTFATPPSPLAAAGTPSGPAYGGGGLNDYRANPISFDLTHTSSTTGTITHVPVRSVTFSKAINKGCTWSAVASNIAAVPAFTSADVWRMSVSCMDVDNVPNIWQSPPLVAPERLNTVALSGLSQDIKGVDQTSWLLSTEGVSQPTLPFTSAAQVLFLLELMTGVSVVNPPNQALEEYTISGSTMQRHLEDVLLQCSYGYRIGDNGQIVCFPSNFSYVTNRPLVCKEITVNPNENSLYTHLKLIKRSKIASEFNLPYDKTGVQSKSLTTPLIPGSIEAADHPSAGHLAYAAFYDAGGGINRIFTFDTEFDGVIPSSTSGSGPSTVCYYAGIPDTLSGTLFGHLYVHGTPYVSGGGAFDTTPYFEIDYPVAVPGATGTAIVPFGPFQMFDGVTISFAAAHMRLKVKTIQTAVLPEPGDGITLAPLMWQDANKAYCKVGRKLARFDPWADVADLVPETYWHNTRSRVTELFVPASRTEGVTWSLNAAGSWSQSVTGSVPVPLVSGATAIRVDIPLDSYYAGVAPP